jgi:lipoprotein signal peptidase
MNRKKESEVKEGSLYEYLFLFFTVILFADRMLKTFLNDGCFWNFCIKKTMNIGAAFGILPGMTWFFIAIAAVVLISIMLFMNEFNKIGKIALMFIAAGTAANMIDRIFFSHVIDLFSVFKSSSFNLADISNVVGGILLVISLIRKK